MDLWGFHRIRRRVEKEPDGASYRDIATTPVTPEELESLELYDAPRPAAETAVIKVQRKRKAVAQAAASAS